MFSPYLYFQILNLFGRIRWKMGKFTYLIILNLFSDMFWGKSNKMVDLWKTLWNFMLFMMKFDSLWWNLTIICDDNRVEIEKKKNRLFPIDFDNLILIPISSDSFWQVQMNSKSFMILMSFLCFCIFLSFLTARGRKKNTDGCSVCSYICYWCFERHNLH